MKDSEMLDLAAKHYGMTVKEMHCPITGPWNPLKDIGSAMALAVKLRLSVCFTVGIEGWESTVMVGYSPWTRYSSPIASERLEGVNENLLTSRAIVRAAVVLAQRNEFYE